MQRQHKKNRAFTLTELAIVLGVIGAVIGAIWYASGNVSEARKENDAVLEVQTVAQNIATLMVGRTFPGGELTSSMITAQTIPPSYVDSAAPATADNPWSASNFKVFNVTNNKTFRLSLYNVPRKACLALLTQMTNCQTGQSTCPTVVWTNGAATTCAASQNGCTGAVFTSPGWTNLTTTLANTLCNANSYTGGTNSVEFDFTP